MRTRSIPDKEDLFYELRLLLGAAKLCQLADEVDLGNTINYFKDSAYVHARNLYNFFTKAEPGSDGSITQYAECVISSGLYPNPWKKYLNQYVMHIRNRSGSVAVVNGKHINMMIQDFADDIKNLWQQWVNKTTDPKLKAELQDLLDKAQREVQEDYDNLRGWIKK